VSRLIGLQPDNDVDPRDLHFRRRLWQAIDGKVRRNVDQA
jgi:hypothetical protein